jgi:2-desacetyl-2-hydroxyethyl bacteriochlorophyllide A dehydrogenase
MTVKTIILTEPGQLALTRTAPSDDLSADEAIVLVRRIGICGTDLHAFKGEQPFFSYPRILGHELGVEVASAGKNALDFKPGDRCAVEPYLSCGQCIACRRGKTNCCVGLQCLGVHTDGGMREWIKVPLAKLHRSDCLSLDQLALVEPLCIGAHAVARAQIETGEFALVIGAGPIGLSVIQFAQLAGAQLIVMDVNEERLRFARQHFDIEFALAAGNEAVEQLRDATRGDMPTVVFDATGNLRSMEVAFDFVAHGGRLVLVGLVQGSVSFRDQDAHRRELTLLRSRNATASDFRTVIHRLESGKIDIRSWITHRVSFDDVITQFHEWLSPKARFIKAVVEV